MSQSIRVPAFPPLRSTESIDDDAETAGPGKRGPYRKSIDTRERILAAAMDVFATHGFRSGSLKEIGELAELDHTSISHYFPTKTALLLAVMQERDRRADELIASLHPETQLDIPEAFLELARRNASTPGVIELYAVLAAESLAPEHPLADYFRDRMRTLREGFTSWFEVLESEGSLREGVDPRIAASSFWALWEGVQLHWLIDRTGVDVVENLSHFLGLVLREGAHPAASVDPAVAPEKEH